MVFTVVLKEPGKEADFIRDVFARCAHVCITKGERQSVQVVCREQDAALVVLSFEDDKIRHLDRMVVDQDGACAMMCYLL